MNDDSLIRKSQEQPMLFDAELVEAAFLPLEKEGIYSGERLYTQEPLKYQQIVILSSKGIGQLQISKLLKVSHSTVRAVQRREGATIDIVKKALSEVMLDGAHLAAEEFYRRLQECPGSIPAKELVIGLGILTDKGLLTAGQPTMRLEVETKQTDHEAFNAYLTGFGAGISAANGGAPGGAALRPPGAPGGGAGPAAASGPGAGPSGPVIDVEPLEPPADSQSPE